MDTNAYFMLLTDTPQSRTLDKNSRNLTSSAGLVERGSLWKAVVADRTDSYSLPSVPASTDSDITVFSCEQDGMSLICSVNDLERLNKTEFMLLLAVSSRSHRYRLAVDKAWDFKDIVRVSQRWIETASSVRQASYRTGAQAAVEDVYVYLLGQKGLPERAAGKVQYIGPLPSLVGLWFGVVLASVRLLFIVIYHYEYGDTELPIILYMMTFM